MLTDQQLAALTAMDRQLGAQDPALGKAMDTVTPVVRVPRGRRCAQWVGIVLVVLAPLAVAAVLVVIPLPVLAGGGVLLTSVAARTVARRRARRARAGPA
jgi:hypothetical protein